MSKTFAVVGAFVLTMVLSAVLSVAPISNRQVHAENHELSDAAVAEGRSVTFVVASLTTVGGLALIAKRYLVSNVR